VVIWGRKWEVRNKSPGREVREQTATRMIGPPRIMDWDRNMAEMCPLAVLEDKSTSIFPQTTHNDIRKNALSSPSPFTLCPTFCGGCSKEAKSSFCVLLYYAKLILVVRAIHG